MALVTLRCEHCAHTVARPSVGRAVAALRVHVADAHDPRAPLPPRPERVAGPSRSLPAAGRRIPRGADGRPL